MTEFMDSKYFTWEEVTFSEYAERHGIGNHPPEEVIDNIIHTSKCADALREKLGTPIRVSSWFRCFELNRAIGSKDTSDHPHGWSIDFTSPKFGSVTEVFEFIRSSGIKFDQLILECGRWVHISFNPRLRGEVLGYNGKTYRLLEVKKWIL